MGSGAYLSLHDPPVPIGYYAVSQAYRPRLTVVARTAVDPATLLEPVRRALTGVRADAAVYRTTTLEAHLSEAFATDRLSAALVRTCGALATLLAAAAPVLLALVTVAAAIVPIRRALRLEPTSILRQE